MRIVLLCILVVNFILALPQSPPEGCAALLPTGSDRGLYQLWLRSDTGEQLIQNNLTPGPDGIRAVTGLPEPGPGERYEFRMIGAGEGQTFDPAPKPAALPRF